MKKITFLLMWICTAITFDAISQDCPEPIIVTITSVKISDCEYEVNIDVVPPDIPFEMDDFDLTVLLTGITGIEKEFCDFGLCPMNCTADVGFISLFCGNQTMTSDDVRGGFSAEFSTDGCIDASNITPISSNPCIIFINESKCPDPIPTEDICVQIDLIGQAMNCDLPGNYPISVLSGCNASTSTAFTGPNDGICFPTVDDECIQLDLLQGDCGCSEDILDPITATDLFAITDYILGIRNNPLSTQYALTLGDVDCSGSLTAIDLITIQKYILQTPNDGNGSCPDVGDCVLIDESTGDIINEFCAGDNVDLVAGVMGDFDNSCNPCGSKALNDMVIPEITLFDQEIRHDGSHLVFNQDIQFNSLTITLDRKSVQSIDDFTLIKFDSKNVIVDFELSDNYLYLTIFSKELLQVNKGQTLLINDKNIDLTFYDMDNALNFIYSDGAKEIGQIQLAKEKNVNDFRVISDNNNLYLMDFYSNDNTSIFISNISGQVIHNQKIYSAAKKHEILLHPRNEIIFISIINEGGVTTKKVFY